MNKQTEINHKVTTSIYGTCQNLTVTGKINCQSIHPIWQIVRKKQSGLLLYAYYKNANIWEILVGLVVRLGRI